MSYNRVVKLVKLILLINIAMSHQEGYLIKHGEENEKSQVFYFVLNAGSLEYYSKRFGVLVGEIPLTGFKIRVTSIPDPIAKNCPHSFRIQTQKTELLRGKQHFAGPVKYVILSARTQELKEKWANSIFAWQRNYWGKQSARRDTTGRNDMEYEMERLALEQLLIAGQKPKMFGGINIFQLFHRRPKLKYSISLPEPLFQIDQHGTKPQLSDPAA